VRRRERLRDTYHKAPGANAVNAYGQVVGSSNSASESDAVGLVALALGWSVFGLAPMPDYGSWHLHAMALETSLFASAMAALVVGWWSVTRRSWRRLIPNGALVAFLLGLWPLAAVIPTYLEAGTPFSCVGYVLGLMPGSPPGELEIDRDVRLEPSSKLLADLYRPRSAGVAPLVVVIHGGAWRGGDKGQVEDMSWALAEAGYAVADLQYSLGPAHPFPQAVRDVKCLVGRLRQSAEAWGVDSSRIAYLGRSAGGQVALLAAYSAGDPRLMPACDVPDTRPHRVAALYAPTDLAWAYDHPSRPDVVRGPEALELYLGGPPSRYAEVYRLASPTSWTSRPVPATLLIHGTADRLVASDHALRLASALSRSGQPARLLLIPGAEHGFDFRRGGIAEQLAHAALLDFLAPMLAGHELTASSTRRPEPVGPLSAQRAEPILR